MLQALSEKHNSFLRPLKKKGFKEKRVTIIGLYDIGKSHDPGIQQEPRRVVHTCALRPLSVRAAASWVCSGVWRPNENRGTRAAGEAPARPGALRVLPGRSRHLTCQPRLMHVKTLHRGASGVVPRHNRSFSGETRWPAG